MIERVRGDLLACAAEAQVNAVNTVGVMGKGIAAQFKRLYPDNFAAYRAACERGALQIGDVLTFDRGAGVPRYILNVPTKRHWRARSRLEDVEAGLVALVAEARRLGVASLAVPALGCGAGGLAWAEVLPRIEAHFAALPELRVQVFEPG